MSVRNAFIFKNGEEDFYLSVQASDGHYCSPKETHESLDKYTAVEVGWPMDTRPKDLDPSLADFEKDFDGFEIAGWMPLPRFKELLRRLTEILGPVTNPDEAGKLPKRSATRSLYASEQDAFIMTTQDTPPKDL